MLKPFKRILLVVGAWLLLPLFLLLTNPETIALPLLIVPFVLLAISLYITSVFCLDALPKDISKKRTIVISLAIALLPTLLLVLASIRQLTIRDLIIVIGLLVLLVFYMRRIDFMTS